MHNVQGLVDELAKKMTASAVNAVTSATMSHFTKKLLNKIDTKYNNPFDPAIASIVKLYKRG